MLSTGSLYSIRLFYAAYFAAMGLILPFFPVYLAERGLDVVVIGIMTGLLAATKVIAPPFIGHLADRRSSAQSRLFIVVASLFAGIFAWAMGLTTDLWLLALFVFMFGLLWSAILPLTDGISVAVSEASLADYGRLRVWGSIGFVLASLAGGLWLVDGGMQNFPYWLLLLMLVLAMAARGFPDRDVIGEHDEDATLQFSKSFYILLIVSFLMQVSHGAYYGFFSLYLMEIGYQGWQIGAFWVLGVLAEIVLMWGFSKPLQQAAPAWVLSASLFVAALRWIGLGMTEIWIGLLLLQLLHAATFAAFHLSAIAWVKRLAPAKRHATAQGWYSASGFGLGSTVGIIGSGLIVSHYGYTEAFFVCALVALLGMVLAWKLPRKQLKKR